MQATSSRAQLRLVGVGYAAVLTVGAALFYARHLQYTRDPALMDASGGMSAAGDTLLALFVACLFMVPTVFLIWVTAKFESYYNVYSRVLLALALTAPVCLAIILLGGASLMDFKVFFFLRLFWSPFVIVGMGMSRLAARFAPAMKLTLYALLIEGLTFAMAIALLVQAWTKSR